MIGAIIGDIVGSPYESDLDNIKTEDFRLLSKKSKFTDDTVMTVAVAEAMMSSYYSFDPLKTYELVKTSMLKYGNKYPLAGYGKRFDDWLKSGGDPYKSYGNGSAMRVSSVGWCYSTIYETELYAAVTAKPTHNHPEGIKGAKAVASAIFLSRNNVNKNDIKKYISIKYRYDIDRTLDSIRKNYMHDESCQGSVPEAIIAFLEGNNYEDVIRKAVSLGGDSDTIAAIAGSIAEAYYGVPKDIEKFVISRLFLDSTLLSVIEKWKFFIHRIERN